MNFLPMLENIKQKLSFFAAVVEVNHGRSHWSTKMMSVASLEALDNTIYHLYGPLLVMSTKAFPLFRLQLT